MLVSIRKKTLAQWSRRRKGNLLLLIVDMLVRGVSLRWSTIAPLERPWARKEGIFIRLELFWYVCDVLLLVE